MFARICVYKSHCSVKDRPEVELDKVALDDNGSTKNQSVTQFAYSQGQFGVSAIRAWEYPPVYVVSLILFGRLPIRTIFWYQIL